jgi:RNA polymerase sigma factor (sigma-70 family)
MAATAVPVRSRRAARRRRLSPVGDDRLVARVRAGDHDAFEAIYDRYYLGLLAFCRHMLGSRDEAEDALQHSFVSAYRALRGGDGDIDLRPWLYTIARNRCLSALRAQRELLELDGAEMGARPLDGLAAEIQLRADLRDLVEDLQRLPDAQRAALVLFELGDQSHEQIAAVLGVRREKVKALVFQAREALLRARTARPAPCAEIREQLATLTGEVPRRSMMRNHIDRCPGCAAFEHEVRRQRAAFAAILPVAPTMGLKASALALLGGGGGAAALGGASTATVAGGVAAGGTTVGLASLGAKGVVTKVLAVVALAGGASEARSPTQRPSAHRAPVSQRVTPPYENTPAAVRRAVTAPYVSPAGRHAHRAKAPRAPASAPGATAPTSAPAPAPAPSPSQAPPNPSVVPGAAPAAPAAQQVTTPALVDATPETSPAPTPAPATNDAAVESPAAPAATETAVAPVSPPVTVAPTDAPATAAPATNAETTSTATPQQTTTASAPATAAPTETTP